MGPADLASALCGLSQPADPNLLVGIDGFDDAGVYRLSDEIALVQTVDFFTPIADDPYLFGRIAAVNALSDVYAMGGRPLCAMNIVCFPLKKLGAEVLREILRGGLDVLKEAGVTLAGGHSIDDKEPKYGLAVTGLVHPDRFWSNRGARVGDALVLTKPLGTGVMTTALKRDRAEPGEIQAVMDSMCTLNRIAAEALADLEVHACTDVTGFGLAGHALEMVEGTAVGLRFHSRRLPAFQGALAACRAGMIPGGLRRNQRYRESLVDFASGMEPAWQDLIYDPQTSGGLLVALPRGQADRLVARLREQGMPWVNRVGEVVEELAGRISFE